MRSSSNISRLLLLFLTVSGFLCASGGGTGHTNCAPPRKLESRDCGHRLTPQSGHCSLRSFAQFQFIEFRRFEITSPLQGSGGRVSRAHASPDVLSSVGPSETDRGPPRS